jgi:hypothetical protein
VPEDQPTAPAPVEAREVPAGAVGPRPVRTRTWTRGEPVVEIHTGGRWQLAHLLQRQDWADGTVVYGVTIATPDGASSTYRAYAWDARSIRPVHPGTADPIERTSP